MPNGNKPVSENARRQNLLTRSSNFLPGNVRAMLRVAGLRIPTTTVNRRARVKHVANAASAKARQKNNGLRQYGLAISRHGKWIPNENKNNLAAKLNLTRNQLNKLISLTVRIHGGPNLSNTKFIRSLIQMIRVNPNTATNYYFYGRRLESLPTNLFFVNPETGEMNQRMLEHPNIFFKRPQFNPRQVSLARGLRLL